MNTKLWNVFFVYSVFSLSALATSPPPSPPWYGKLVIFSNNCHGVSFSIKQSDRSMIFGYQDAKGAYRQIVGNYSETTNLSNLNELTELTISNGRTVQYLALSGPQLRPGATATVQVNLAGRWLPCDATVWAENAVSPSE